MHVKMRGQLSVTKDDSRKDCAQFLKHGVSNENCKVVGLYLDYKCRIIAYRY